MNRMIENGLNYDFIDIGMYIIYYQFLEAKLQKWFFNTFLIFVKNI